MNKTNLLTAILGLSFSTQALTLDEALKSAAEKSPELRAARAETQAADADIRTASLWSNPELGFTAEGLGKTSGGSGSAEYTLGLAQELPTSGKVRKGRAVASHAAEAARLAAQETVLGFQTAVRLAFINAQAARNVREVRKQQFALAESFAAAVRQRYEAGAASEPEILRAEMLRESGRGVLQAAEKAEAAAFGKLARLTGISTVQSLEGDFFKIPDLPGGLTVKETHPELQRLQALENKAVAEVSLAKSAAVPDITVGAGARHEEEGGVQSFLFSVSAPLPLFNRGSTAALASGLRAEAARAERERAWRDLNSELSELLTEFETASAEVSRVRTVLLPKAERAAELVQAGYASGRYGWTETVQIQQELAEQRIAAVEAQRTLLQAHARIFCCVPQFE